MKWLRRIYLLRGGKRQRLREQVTHCGRGRRLTAASAGICTDLLVDGGESLAEEGAGNSPIYFRDRHLRWSAGWNGERQSVNACCGREGLETPVSKVVLRPTRRHPDLRPWP